MTLTPHRAEPVLGSVRVWFAVDALVTGVNAVVYLAAASAVVDLLGSTTGTVRTIGGFLLVFTAVLVAVASPAQPQRRVIRLVVAVNLIWVVASVVVAATGVPELTELGRVWALAQAAVVGVLAGMQYRTGISSR